MVVAEELSRMTEGKSNWILDVKDEEKRCAQSWPKELAAEAC